MLHTDKNGYNKSCIYTHEQCTAANAQWSRMMDIIVNNAKHPGQYKSFKPSVDQNVLNFLRCAKEENVRNQENINQNQPLNSNEELINTRGVTPWREEGKNYSPGLQGLHEEIEDFCNYIQPLPEERNMRCDVIQRIQLIVSSIWPAAEVQVFGSFETGLYLPTSDIDLVVRCPTLDPQNALHVLQQQLINRGEYDDIKVIKTSVPIVKFTDRRTAVRVDISFNVSTGIMSADFINGMVMAFPELRFLVFILKQFLLSKQLLESFNGGISSYCLILLIVSYLQLHPEDRLSRNHGDRLIKFLELYGRHFNYLKCGIRVNNGGSYFRKADSEGDPAKCYSLLCIEDPFNPANDIGQGCFGAMKVRDEFDQAFRELCDAVLPQYRIIQPTGASMLARILLVAPELVTYRRIIRERYPINYQPQTIFQFPHSIPAYRFSPGQMLPDQNIYLPHMPPIPFLQPQIHSAPHSMFAEDRSDTDSVGSQTSNRSITTQAHKLQNENAQHDNDSDLNENFKRMSTNHIQASAPPNQPPPISVNLSHPTQPVQTPISHAATAPLFPLEHFPPMPTPVNHTIFRQGHPGLPQPPQGSGEGTLPRSSSWHNGPVPRLPYHHLAINPSLAYTRPSGASSPGDGANKAIAGTVRTIPEVRRKRQTQTSRAEQGPIKSASMSSHHNR